MATNLCIDHLKIAEIINTMAYGTNLINLNRSKEWLAKHEYKFHNLEIPSLHDLKPINSKVPIDQQIFVTNFSEEIALQVLVTLKTQERVELKKSERSNILLRIADLVVENADLFAELVLLTKGVTMKTTKNVDIQIMVEYLQFYSTYCEDKVLLDSQNNLIVVPAENALCTLVLKLASAIATGFQNIVLFVEAEMVPCGFLLTELCYKAGLPKSSLTVLSSYDRYSVGFPILCKDNYFTNVVYIGEIEGGKTLKYCLAGFPRKLSLMTRSKCSMIVHNDSDLKSACEAIIENGWSHFGELPWNLSHVYVQESVYDNFIKMLKERMDKLIIDSVLNKMADIGLIEKDEFNVTELCDRVNDLGGKIYYPKINKDGGDKKSYFVPIILYDVPIINDDELMPVVTVLPYRNIIEAAKLVNNTKYGLAASIWSETHSLIQELQQLLDVSLIWINNYGVIKPEVSITPYKQSGFGWFGGRSVPNDEVFKLCDPYSFYESPGEDNTGKSQEVCTKVELSKKAFQVWSKWSFYKREQYLKRINQDFDVGWSPALNTSEITIHVEPVGVTVLDIVSDIGVMDYLLAQLLFGNTVIIVNSTCGNLTEVELFCKSMVSIGIPNNVVTIINCQDFLRTLISHEDVNSYVYQKGASRNRINRARHIEWRAINNLKRTSIVDKLYDPTSLIPYLYRLKTIITSPGHSLTS